MAISADGTLTLTDKATGEIYRDLLTFADRSEIADGWFHAHSINDEELLSTGSSVQTAVVHDGPEVVTFRVSITMQVPQRFDEATQTPSEHLVPLVITSLVRLRRGARVLDLEVTVDNTAEDHRMQMLLPTDCAGATTWLAHQPFDFVERPVALDPRSASWQEMEQAEKPFLGIESVGHGQRGLARFPLRVFTKGASLTTPAEPCSPHCSAPSGSPSRPTVNRMAWKKGSSPFNSLSFPLRANCHAQSHCENSPVCRRGLFRASPANAPPAIPHSRKPRPEAFSTSSKAISRSPPSRLQSPEMASS